MSFTITFYTNISNEKKLEKDITAVFTATGTFRESVDLIMNPSLLVECQPEDIASSNYMYIPPLERYYFIDKVTSERNNIMRITGRIDSLMSNADTIKLQTAILRRSTSHNNTYLNDGSFITYQDSFTMTKAFDYTFSDMSYILLMAGGNTTDG